MVARCSANDSGYINLIVLAELFWLLDSSYKYSREQQVSLLQNMLQLDDLIIEAADDVYAALKLFGTHNAQLANCLIAVRNQRAECRFTYTFDKSASKMDGFDIEQTVSPLAWLNSGQDVKPLVKLARRY